MSLVSIFLFLGLRGFFSSYSLSRNAWILSITACFSEADSHRPPPPLRFEWISSLVFVMTTSKLPVAPWSLMKDIFTSASNSPTSTLCKATAYRWYLETCGKVVLCKKKWEGAKNSRDRRTLRRHSIELLRLQPYFWTMKIGDCSLLKLPVLQRLAGLSVTSCLRLR